MAKILAFSGSGRAESWNQKLVSVAAQAAKSKGAEVTVVNLRDFDIPIYDGDMEAETGMPPGAAQLKQLLEEHQGLLIASPEYNSSVTALLKNSIDWATRPSSANEPPLVAFQGKVAGLMAASPGSLGGLRGLVHLRAILSNLGVLVVPKQLAVSKAHEAFDENGDLTVEFHRETVLAISTAVVDLANKLNTD